MRFQIINGPNALKGLKSSAVEVHLSTIHTREEFRKTSITAHLVLYKLPVSVQTATITHNWFRECLKVGFY